MESRMPERTLVPEPETSSVACENCGNDLGRDDVWTLQGMNLCGADMAERAVVILDPNGSLEVTAADITEAARLLVMWAVDARRERLSQFAGVVRGSVS